MSRASGIVMLFVCCRTPPSCIQALRKNKYIGFAATGSFSRNPQYASVRLPHISQTCHKIIAGDEGILSNRAGQLGQIYKHNCAALYHTPPVVYPVLQYTECYYRMGIIDWLLGWFDRLFHINWSLRDPGEVIIQKTDLLKVNKTETLAQEG